MREAARHRPTPRALFATAIVMVALMLPQCQSASAPAPTLLITLGDASVAPVVDRGAESTAIALLQAATPGWEQQRLIDGFTAIGTPRMSYDGQRAVFAARRTRGDPAQIWEMSLSGSRPTLIARGRNAFDPAYLPDGRIVFARPLSGGFDGPIALYTVAGDGTAERRITFGDAHDQAPAVLPDGRVIFRRYLRAGQHRGELFVVNPDGTGIQFFAAPSPGASIGGGPWVIDDEVVFAEEKVEQAQGQFGQWLVSVSAHEPLGRRDLLADGDTPGASSPEWFSSVSALPDAGLVSAAYVKHWGWTAHHVRSSRTWSSTPFPSAVSLPSFGGNLRATGLVLAAPHKRPLSLTSVVDERKSTGTLLCTDVRASRLTRVTHATGMRSVRVLAADGMVLTEGRVEADGSFFLEVPADQPLHLELRDGDTVVAKDHSGFWVRPNENRACIGCHEDPELAPDNRVLLALERGMVPLGSTLPASWSGDHTW